MFYKMGMSVTTLVATCKLLDDKTACSIEEVNKKKKASEHMQAIHQVLDSCVTADPLYFKELLQTYQV